ncbi:hypothetical protein C8R44DRAFT_750783 [Mycena epipterygia]|nr:hypothetical protein C8R44DRAFT_750783 [Mycena epipterygia]
MCNVYLIRRTSVPRAHCLISLIQKRPPSAFTLRYSAISHDRLAALPAVTRGAHSPYVTAFWSSCAYAPSSISRCHIFRTAGPSRLLSTLTPDTPVSGFHGPGSWWAWLITLGMSPMHMVGALVRIGRVLLEWDYDLIAASCYTVVAAVDLIVKSCEIARLGATASDSTLLPALAAAEYVVWVDTASSMFTLWKGLWSALYAPGFRFSSFKRAMGIAIVPVLSTFVAWGFSLRAHQAIAQTASVFWCFAHNWNNEDPMGILHMPAEIALPWAEAYASPLYWQFCSVVTAATNRGRGNSKTRIVVHSKGWIHLLRVCLMSFSRRHRLLRGALGFDMAWVGYFPATGISVLKMDQVAALLAAAIVAAIRILRLISKVLASADFHASEPHELGSLLLT